MARSTRQAAAKVSFFAFQDIITSVSGILIIMVILMVLMVEDGPPAPDKGNPNAGSIKKLAGVLDDIKKIRIETANLNNVLKGLLTSPKAEEIQKEIKILEAEIARLVAVATQRNLTADFSIMQPPSQTGDAADAKANNKGVEKDLAGKTDERDKLFELKKQLEDQLSKAKNDVFITVGSLKDQKTPVAVVVSGTGIEVFAMGKNLPESKHDGAAATAAINQLLGALDPAAKYILFYVKPSGVALFDQLRNEVIKTQFSVGYDALGEASTPKFGPGAPASNP